MICLKLKMGYCRLVLKGYIKLVLLASVFRSVYGNSISDHLVYYGVDLKCENWRSCGIVMSSHVNEYGKTDSRGNVVLSRNPGSPILKLETGVDAKTSQA